MGHSDPVERLELVIRSVGPAGGPVKKMAWDGKQLHINERWTLTFEPQPERVVIGHEGDPRWKTESAPQHQGKGEDGWGYARVPVTAGRPTKLTVQDSAPAQPNPLRYSAVRSPLDLDLPDQRFTDCLHAQVAHLMMGLLDRRTPPGEPTNYPLAWQRDGAVVIAALVRAGQKEVAGELVRFFAENDFFGGFGAEGDAPGQALRHGRRGRSRG